MNWLLSYAVGTTTTVATAATPSSSEPTDCPSPSSPALGAGGAGANEETDSGSSPSASSSSSADAFSFSPSGQQTLSTSTSTSALCFGAGGTGRLWWSSSEALARASKIHEEKEVAQQAAAASVAPRGHAVGRHLRRMSRRLRKARAANKETPAAPPPPKGAVDDTARGDARPPAAVFPTALAAQVPRLRLTHIHGGRQSAAAAAATGRLTPSSSQIMSGLVATRETETRGSFSELEFLETFDGDEELIDRRHFITVQI